MELGQDSVARFYTRQALVFVVALSALLGIFAHLLGRQYRLHQVHDRYRLQNQFLEQVAHLDSLLASVAMLVGTLQVQATADLTESLNTNSLKPPKAFDLLCVDAAQGRFHLDRPGRSSLDPGNLTGEGELAGRSEDFYRELFMALRLNPMFRAITQRLPNVAWVYYTSASRFINIYPWVASEEFRFTPELYTHGFYSLGLPDANSARSAFWTEVYVAPCH